MLTISEYNLILILLLPSPWNIQSAMCLCCYLATPLEHTSSNVLVCAQGHRWFYTAPSALNPQISCWVLIRFLCTTGRLKSNALFLFSLVQCCISYTFDTGCLHPFPQTLIHVPLAFVVLGFFCKYLFKMI